MIRRFLKAKYIEDSRHLVEIILDLSERLVDLLFEQEQRDLRGLGVPVVAAGDAGYVWVLDVSCGKVSKRFCKGSETLYIARWRPNPLKSAI